MGIIQPNNLSPKFRIPFHAGGGITSLDDLELELDLLASDKIDGAGLDIAELVDRANGYNFVNATGVQRPHYNAVDITADGDGTGKNLSSDAFGAAVASDTTGMFTMYFHEDDGTGIVTPVFTMYNEAANYVFLYIDDFDKLTLTLNVAGVPNIIKFDNTNLARSDWNKIQVGTTGSSYRAYINGIPAAVTSGTDNGLWIGSLSKAAFQGRLMKNFVNDYGFIRVRHFGYSTNSSLMISNISNINALAEYQEVFVP